MKTLKPAAPTAGPWTFSGQLIVGPPEPHANPKAQPEGKVVASLAWNYDGDHGATERRTTWPEAEANGRLMIASRAMYDALRAIVSDCREVLEGREELRMDLIHAIVHGLARRALEKAEGGAT